MNVNRLSSIEKQALFRQKFIQEGKPAEKANEEIERDISFEENLAWNLKENKKYSLDVLVLITLINILNPTITAKIKEVINLYFLGDSYL